MAQQQATIAKRRTKSELGDIMVISNQTLVIRRCNIGDAPILTALGARTFLAAFGKDNERQHIEGYVDEAFSAGKIVGELRESGSIFYLAELDGVGVGYAKLREGEAPNCVDSMIPIELERIYVERTAIGQGIGTALMRTCLDEAKRSKHDVLWLGVWERNPHAIAFYEKCGFAEVGDKMFVLGEDPQRDVVMVRSL